MKSALAWTLMALSMATGLSACILVPVGGGDHEDHDHY